MSEEAHNFRCGINMSASASSRRPLGRNDPCNPAKESFSSFEWMPNDQRMFVTYTFNTPFVLPKSIEIVWGYYPLVFALEC